MVKGPPSWNERCVLVIFVLFWAYAVFGCRFCFTSGFMSPFLPSFLFVSFCFCSTGQLVPRAVRDFCNIPFERRCLVGIGDTCWRFFSLRGILCSFPPSTLLIQFCLSSTSQPVSCAVRDICNILSKRRCLVGICDSCWWFFSLCGFLCTFPPSTLFIQFCLCSISQRVSGVVKEFCNIPSECMAVPCWHWWHLLAVLLITWHPLFFPTINLVHPVLSLLYQSACFWCCQGILQYPFWAAVPCRHW